MQVVNVCSTYLENQLDLENCVDVMTLAETYTLTRLKRIVYRFVSQNISKLSNNSTIAERLTAEQIEHLLTADFPVDVTEIKVLAFILSWITVKHKESQGNWLSEKAYRLLRKLEWTQIGEEELRNYISSQLCYSDTVKRKHLLNELMSIKAQYCDTEGNGKKADELTAGLINSRGLESALIAVGI